MKIPFPGLAASKSAAIRVAVATISLAAVHACSDTGEGVATPTVGKSDLLNPTSAAGSTIANNRNGITDNKILFGQSAAFSGPASELGLGMRTGILAAFSERNAQGGVHGRQIDLAFRDDAYEPEAAIANTAALIDEDKVFALVGAVGTPTSRSAVPVAEASGVPYVAPFTGAEFLRSPDYQHILNVRASYYQETAAMVRRLMEDLDITRIAVMYQDDSFGRAGYQGVRIALEEEGMEPVAIGIYPRNTKAIKTALLDLQQGEPEAVIMIGAYEPVAHLISWARHTEFNPKFMTVSFVGSNALARELGEYGEGVYVTQVVPFPGTTPYRLSPTTTRRWKYTHPRNRRDLCPWKVTSPGDSLSKSPRDADATSIVNASCRICGTATSLTLVVSSCNSERWIVKALTRCSSPSSVPTGTIIQST